MEDVFVAYQSLRAALAELLSSVGVDATKTRETARELGLNRGLTWRVSRLVRSGDDLSAVSDVPGRESMAKLLATCSDRGAVKTLVTTAQRAVEEFESAVDACAGDRKTLAMLMANRGAHSSTADVDRTRRRLFEGACGMWGVQARVRFVTVFAFPSPDDPNGIDAAHTTGYIDFRRLSDRAWPMIYEVVHGKDGAVVPFKREPLEPSPVGEVHVPLVREFCDPARPPISTRLDGGTRVFELEPGPVGNQGVTTCVFGTVLRSLYERHPPEPNTAGFMVILQTPVEHLLFDLFVHRDLNVLEPPRAELLDRLTVSHGGNEADFARHRMPLPERPRPLRSGTAGAFTHHIGWYPRLLTRITERIGLSIDAFDGSRFEMAHPPISTAVSRRFDLFPRSAEQ